MLPFQPRSRQCAEVTLPPTNTVRWVASRKIMVLAAIDAGSLSIEEACLMYRLSIEEIASWSRLTELHGRDGLKTSKLGKISEKENERRRTITLITLQAIHGDRLLVRPWL